MANLTGISQIYHGDTTEQDSSALVTLGTRAFEANGNEYVYMRGTASVVTGNWVLYDENYTTKRADTDDVGPLAVAGTAHTASTYGWFQVRGHGTASCDLAVAADAALYLTANSGYVDDADAAGEFIEGAVSRIASSGSSVTVYLSYPIAYNAAQD